MKILFFGGAFDPPHLGHSSILISAMKYTNFDKVIIMPTGTPTHKNNCVAPFEVRKYLAEIAFCPLSSKIEVSDYEGVNLKDDYTYLTLQHLKLTYPNADIFMLIGGDSLLSLKNWKESERIIKSCTILSFARKQNEQEKIINEINRLEKTGAKIKFIQNDIRAISSSEVRFYQEQEKDTSDLIENNIKNIIDKYNIYDADEYLRVSSTTKLLLKLLLDSKREAHTYNVEKLAVALGKVHSVDTKKLSLAALLHDVMKNAPVEILLHRACQSDIIEKIKSKPIQTLHGYAAADYAKKELNVQDAEILSALKSHTCGRWGMTDFEKIIYLSDMLCEEREFESKELLLSIAYKNLDMAMKASVEKTLEWLNQNGKILDEESKRAFEYFTETCKIITYEGK